MGRSERWVGLNLVRIQSYDSYPKLTIWRGCPRVWSIYDFKNQKFVTIRKPIRITFYCIFNDRMYIFMKIDGQLIIHLWPMMIQLMIHFSILKVKSLTFFGSPLKTTFHCIFNDRMCKHFLKNFVAPSVQQTRIEWFNWMINEHWWPINDPFIAHWFIRFLIDEPIHH